MNRQKAKKEEKVKANKKQHYSEQQQTQSIEHGRRKCECQAIIHRLINNCLFCGRVVCEQEGQGSCFYCGNQVLDRERKNYPELQRKQYLQITGESNDLQQLKAIQHKDKLIGYEQNDQQNKQIIDENTDWYSIVDDIWQKDENRDQAVQNLMSLNKKVQEESTMINIQFDGRSFVDNSVDVNKIYEEGKAEAQEYVTKINDSDRQTRVLSLADQIRLRDKQNIKQQELDHHFKQQELLVSQRQQEQDYKLQLLDQKAQLVVAEQRKELIQQYGDYLMNQKKTVKSGTQTLSGSDRVQHEDVYQLEGVVMEIESLIQPISTLYDIQLYDLSHFMQGRCISLAQPEASLVTNGIRRLIQRPWTTNYRGPIWIYAIDQPPTSQQLQQGQAIMKEYYEQKGEGIEMPSMPNKYPTGCLLGVVDLQTVVTSKEYQQVAQLEPPFISDQDNLEQQQYQFIIRNPRKLIYPVKLNGGNKDIFTLSDDIYENIHRNLQKVIINWTKYQIDKDFMTTSNHNPHLFEQIFDQSAYDEEQKIKAQKDTISFVQQDDQVLNQTNNTLNKTNTVVKKQEETNDFLNYKFYGQTINNVLKTMEIDDIVQELEMRAKQKNSRAIDIKQSIEIPMDVTFPYLQKIFQSVPNNRKKLLTKLKTIKFFFVNQRSKQFTLNENVLIFMYIGQTCEIQFEDEKQNKQESVKNGTIIVKANNTIKIKFVSLQNEKIPQQLPFSNDQKGLFVFFPN